MGAVSAESPYAAGRMARSGRMATCLSLLHKNHPHTPFASSPHVSIPALRRPKAAEPTKTAVHFPNADAQTGGSCWMPHATFLNKETSDEAYMPPHSDPQHRTRP